MSSFQNDCMSAVFRSPFYGCLPVLGAVGRILAHAESGFV